MQVKQIFTIINSISNEVLGRSDIVAEDLTGIVDLGTEVFNQNQVDNYVKSLVNHIGKVVFVDRPYVGKIPSVLMDSWEFGSVLEKISADIPVAVENESWNLVDQNTYNQDKFNKPTVTAKFFNSKVTFEVDISITERQVKESFSSATQLNGFLSMLYNAVDKSMTIKTDALIMRTINNMIAETIKADAVAFGGIGTLDLTSASTNRAVNLLKLYNDKFTKTLTPAQSILDPEFIRFASYTISMYADRMQNISSLFNVGAKARFTSTDLLHVVLLSDFEKASSVYLYSDTYNKDLVKLPTAETVSNWQGTGLTYAFEDVSSIDVKSSSGFELDMSGILGVMFDRDALGVSNLDKRVTSSYNAKAEFHNNFYKFDAGYFNDTNENFVVFFVA